MTRPFDYDDILDGDAVDLLESVAGAINHCVRVARKKKESPQVRADAWEAVATLTKALRSARALKPPIDEIDAAAYLLSPSDNEYADDEHEGDAPAAPSILDAVWGDLRPPPMPSPEEFERRRAVG